MSTTIINGVELYYEVTGAGDRVVLTHGSWTDGAGWAPAVDLLADRYEVVTWDRRGHSRSQDGAGPGSRAEDAADLASLIEYLGETPVHVVGNSYGASVTLTLVTVRPDLVITAALHEPAVFALLEGSADTEVTDGLARFERHSAVVADLIEGGDNRGAAEYFVENVALGPGSWDQLPQNRQSVMEANAPTYLGELSDETALSIDTAALAATKTPLLLTRGTDSPPLFSAIIDQLVMLVPSAQLETFDGAGHLPHATHPDIWANRLMTFHQTAVNGG